MNVFIVNSPFQYICANEARVAYKAKNNLLVITERKKTNTEKKQMRATVNESEWDTVIYHEGANRTTSIPKLIKRIRKITNKQYDTLFYTEITSWTANLIKRNITFQSHVYFDDGTATIIEYRDFLKSKKSICRKRFVQDFILRLQGIKPMGALPFFENTDLFSVFQFEDCPLNYKKNELSEIQRAVKNERIKEPSQQPNIFIGQGCVGEKGHTNLKDYIRTIKNVLSNTQEDLLYFPHRNESIEVTTEIEKTSGLTYHKPTFPLEIELYQKKIFPKTIIGTVSTALYTLSLMYPETEIKIITYENGFEDSKLNDVQAYLETYFSRYKKTNNQ